jgi:putative hemolysin
MEIPYRSIIARSVIVPATFPRRPFFRLPTTVVFIGDIVRFKRKVPIAFDRKEFTVKTAETRMEMLQACMLRYEVFHKEYAGKRFPVGIDADRYDAWADHLVIIDNRTGLVVGAYRLICSQFSNDFYSASEFDLSGLTAQDGVQLELSRACIRPDHRNGVVMSLLWRGLGAYMAAVNARWLFGLSSVKSIHVPAIADVHRQLREQGRMREEGLVTPRPSFRIPGYRNALDRPSPNREEIPGLFQAYLKAGAEVYDEPALDRDFRCADFLTVLDRQKMSPAHEKKFVRGM